MGKYRKVVLICPKFNSYELLIADVLLKKYKEVHFIQEKKVGFFWDLLTKLFPNVMTYLQKRILNNKISALGNDIDKFFIIRGEYIDVAMINKIRSYSNDIVCYQWDSFENNPASHVFLSSGIKMATFDLADSERYAIKYIPLFHYEYEDTKPTNFYDMSFIGVFTPYRFDVIAKIYKWSLDNKLSIFFYMKISPLSLLKLIKVVLKDWNLYYPILRFVHFKTLINTDAHDIMKKTNVVVDISHKSQSGLTMRFIEAIGLNKRIITNNQTVNKTSGLEINSIAITDSFDSNSFFLVDNIETNHPASKQLYINNWINRVLSQ